MTLMSDHVLMPEYCYDVSDTCRSTGTEIDWEGLSGKSDDGEVNAAIKEAAKPEPESRVRRPPRRKGVTKDLTGLFGIK